MARRSLEEKAAEKLTVADATRYIDQHWYRTSEASVRGKIASGVFAEAVERDPQGRVLLSKTKLDELLGKKYRARLEERKEVAG